MVVQVTSPGQGWVAPLVSFLVGAATALAVQLVVQFFVVPKVETRKRREDRWERNVLELGELLTTRLTDVANELHAEQLVYRTTQDEPSDQYDHALVAQQGRDADRATWDYGGLISTQLDWLIRRVVSLSPKAQELAQLQHLADVHRAQALAVRPLHDQDNRNDSEFDETWEKERAARQALLDQVQLLADLPHPPRAPWRAHLNQRANPAKP